MVENKKTMAKNIKRLMEKKKVNATEICEELDFKHNTFSDWVNGKSYPRIDKIEKMANYFGVNKSELVEEMHFFLPDADFEVESTTYSKEALKLYSKYLSADKKTRNIIDQLLEEGD